MESTLAACVQFPKEKTRSSERAVRTEPIDDGGMLRSLVHHAGWVDHDSPLEAVQGLFTERNVKYFALVRDGHVSGLCSRSRLGQLFGSRYGFSLYSRSPAHLAQIARPLVFSVDTPVTRILEESLARPSEDFHDDVVLVDHNHALIGLVPVDALARLQNRLQRAMERNLRRQEKQTLLDTVVGGIAHELNNKLTPVQGFSELIALTADDHTRPFAQLIGRSAAEAAHIIRQLLQLARPTCSALQTLDLRGAVEEALTMLRFQIRESRCVIERMQPPTPVWVEADPAEIKQVVMNLGLNALQAMEGRSGSILTVSVIETADSAQIVVGDNGVGIAPENMERIFAPFFTTKGPEKGSGLGLSVCCSIVEQHGGRIEATSVPDVGSQFMVVLPRHEQPPLTVAAIPAAPAATRAARDVRVLVVDDEPHVRRLIQTVLTTRFECDVDTAGQGIEAFERLAAQKYALVISDIRMPTMNGTELYLWLCEAQPRLASRFIFVTGFPGENHLSDDIANRRIPVLTKPFSIAQLCDACAPFLTTGAAEQAQLSA